MPSAKVLEEKKQLVAELAEQMNARADEMLAKGNQMADEAYAVSNAVEELKEICEIDDLKLGAFKVENTFKRARYVKPKCYIQELEDDKLKIELAELLCDDPSEIVKDYEGYQMNALLKKTIDMNNFDFARSISEHR